MKSQMNMDTVSHALIHRLQDEMKWYESILETMLNRDDSQLSKYVRPYISVMRTRTQEAQKLCNTYFAEYNKACENVNKSLHGDNKDL